jgi:hypothetical protein
MKRLLLVHNLVHGQSVVHELDDKDFAVELVEGDPETDDQGEMDVESRFFIRVDNDELALTSVPNHARCAAQHRND